MNRKKLSEAYDRAKAAQNNSQLFDKTQEQQNEQEKYRSISVAKEIQPDGLDCTSLGRAQNLKTSFDKAKTQRAANDHQRPDQAQHRPVSAAKEFQPDALKGTSLGQAGNVKPAFDKAKQGAANDQQKPEAQTQKGSTMVKESQPKPVLAPKGEMRRGPDKESFDGRWVEEQKKAQTGLQAAQEKAAAIKAMRDRQAQREQSHGPERD